MRRELLIRGVIGALGAVVMVIVVIVNDVPLGWPVVLMIAAAALIPLLRAIGRNKAYEAGRRIRDGH